MARKRRLDTKTESKRGLSHSSNEQTPLEVLFIRCSRQPEPKEIKDATARILDNHDVRYRLTLVRLDPDKELADGGNPIDDTTSELQDLMESNPAKKELRPKKKAKSSWFEKLSRLSIRRGKQTSLLLIIANIAASHIVQRILVKSNSDLQSRIVGVAFYQESQARDGSERFRYQNSEAEFQRIEMKFKLMFSDFDMPEITVIKDEVEKLSNDLKGPVEAAIQRTVSPPDLGPNPQTPKRANGLGGLPKPESNDVDTASQPASIKSVPYSYSARLTGNSDQFKSPRGQAESCLANHHLKHALWRFEDCLLMDGPGLDAEWEIKGSIALTQICLAHYVEAERALKELLKDIRSSAVPDQAAHIERETTFRYALALSHLGRYDQVLQCLSDMKPSAEDLMSRARVSRLRALSMAHLGFKDLTKLNEELAKADKCCEMLLPDKGGKGRSTRTLDYECTSISNALNRSWISMLRGDYRLALKLLAPALRGAILKLGETNLLTLEAALLHCRLQILTGQVEQGRQSCSKYARIIEKTLSAEHGLALEAEHVLISAAQAQGLLAVAMGDSLSLCHRAESNVNFLRKHPSTLRYRSQLGSIHIQRGNYLDAQDILALVWEDSAEVWSPEHPNTLKIQSELALAQHHLGRRQVAEDNISAALHGQFQQYLKIQTEKLWKRGEEASEFLKSAGLIPRIKAVYNGHRLELSDPMPHPDVLISLLTFGKVLLAKPDSDLELAHDIFRLVRETGVGKFGPSHELPLAASIALGDTFLAKAKALEEVDSAHAQQGEHYGEAVSCYNFVVDQRLEIYHTNGPLHWTNGDDKEAEGHYPMPQLDTSNPTALHARQASLVASILANGDAKPDAKHIQDCRQELEFILMLQKTRPGGSHPQRLKAMVAVLALQVGLGDPRKRVLQTQEELVRRLEREDVRRQRFFESLVIEVRVAEILSGWPELSGECRAVVESITEAIRKAGEIEDLSLRNAVEKVQAHVDTIVPQEHR